MEQLWASTWEMALSGAFPSFKAHRKFSPRVSLLLAGDLQQGHRDREPVRAADAEMGEDFLLPKRAGCRGWGRQQDASFRECLLSQK